MASSLNAHRLLKDYRALAADDYAPGAAGFAALADLAAACLSNVTAEQRLPAMVLQNVFDCLARGQSEPAAAALVRRPVSPELHDALMTAIKFVITGGSPARCVQVTTRLIDATPESEEIGP